jgi:hypothetical protein
LPEALVTTAARTPACGRIWNPALGGNPRQPQLVLGPDDLRSPLAALGWLLHQAAHGLADDRPSAGSDGWYHSDAFRDKAEELELEVTAPSGAGARGGVRGAGWATTRLPEDVAMERYANVLEALNGIEQVPQLEGVPWGRERLTCDHGQVIYVARTQAAAFLREHRHFRRG